LSFERFDSQTGGGVGDGAESRERCELDDEPDDFHQHVGDLFKQVKKRTASFT
jgi:hypothetical protein